MAGSDLPGDKGPTKVRSVNRDTSTQQRISKEGVPNRAVVLLADSEKISRDQVASMLEHLGFIVVTAVDGVEAVRLFLEHRNEIVLVLLEISLPRMDGLVVMDELREIRSEISVYLSGVVSEEIVAERLKGRRIAGYLHKPYGLGELMSRLLEFSK